MQTVTTAFGTRIPAALALKSSPAMMPQGAAATQGQRRSFKEGAELFSEGEAADSFFKLLSGTVRTSKLLSDGRRQIDEFHLAGDIFGLEHSGFHRFTAEAIDDVEVLVFRRSRFSRLLHDDPEFGDLLLDSMLSSLDRAHDHMVLLGRKSAQEKLAAFLLDLAARLTKTDQFDLPMRRSDIADHLGLTIETVSRTLTQMARDGIIKLASGGRTITLSDRLALQQLNN
jgi:CRP/FNR family nitrogen fixation transcriptional regulator